MGDLARAGPLNLAQLPMNSPVGGGIPFAPPGSGGPVIPFVPEDGGGVIPGIPEPATWTLMVFGFGLVGAAVRRNNRKPGLSNDKDRAEEIGRASCRERVCQYVVISVGGGTLKKKQN